MRAEHLMDELLDADRSRRVADLENLGAWSWIRESPPMVLVGQVQRSGGTLMIRLLDGHPQLQVYPHELYWSYPDETKWPQLPSTGEDAARIWKSLTLGHARHALRFSRHGYDKFGRSRRGEALPYLYSPSLHEQLFCKMVAEDARQVLDNYLASFFAAWLDYRDRYVPNKRWRVAFGKRHNLGDTPARFFEDYPDGRLISVVRRPDSWLASASGHQPGKYGNHTHALDTWAASTAATIDLARSDPARVAIVTFEGLVTDSMRTMSRLTDWLAVTPTDGGPLPTFNSMPVHSNSAFEPRRGIDRDAASRGQSSVDRVDRSFFSMYETAAELALEA